MLGCGCDGLQRSEVAVDKVERRRIRSSFLDFHDDGLGVFGVAATEVDCSWDLFGKLDHRFGLQTSCSYQYKDLLAKNHKH